MRSRVDLAVVIVSMNDAEWLPPCLASLEAHGYLTCSLMGVYARTLLRPRAAI